MVSLLSQPDHRTDGKKRLNELCPPEDKFSAAPVEGKRERKKKLFNDDTSRFITNYLL